VARGETFRTESQWKLIILWWTHWGAYPELQESSQEVISPRWRKEEQWGKEKMMEEDVDAMGLVTGPQELRRTVARARSKGALCVDGPLRKSSAADSAMTMDRSTTSKITPNTAENEMSASTPKKYESLVTALSRVEEEARGVGKVQTTVEKVVGTGDSLQEVGTQAMAVGTITEVLGLMEEALGEPVGTMARWWAMFGQFPSQKDQQLV
jgi:hypothetical protein